MTTTGAIIAGTGTSVARSTGTAWTNPGNITANDNTTASCSSGTAGSAYLRASNFGFNIPANSLIQGVTVVVEMAESSAGSELVTVQLVDDTATLIGATRQFTANGTGLTLYTTGSSTDLWGATLTSTIINDTDFGVYVWYTTSHNTTVDYISIDINYEPPRSGSVAANETGSDTAAINGKVRVSGSLSGAEAGSDTAAFQGTVAAAAITGSLAATETGSDTASVQGKVLIIASMAAVEIGADTASFSGAVAITGAVIAQETGSDSAQASGLVLVSGAMSAAEEGEDVFAATVVLPGAPISGYLDASETGQDSFFADGRKPPVNALPGYWENRPRKKQTQPEPEVAPDYDEEIAVLLLLAA